MTQYPRVTDVFLRLGQKQQQVCACTIPPHLTNKISPPVESSAAQLESAGSVRLPVNNCVHHKTVMTGVQVIADITRRMGAGMAKYIERDVETVQDYDEYCHFVAGLVGIGLSQVITTYVCWHSHLCNLRSPV